MEPLSWPQQKRLMQPFFAALQPSLALMIDRPDWPTLSDYNLVSKKKCSPQIQLPSFVEQIKMPNRRQKKKAAPPEAEAKLHGYRYYDFSIVTKKQVPSRPNNWHDFFNFHVWLNFPKSKWALHHLGYETALEHKLPGRARLHDFITLLDEGGIAVFPAINVNSDECRSVLKRGSNDERLKLILEKKIHYFILGHALYDSFLHEQTTITALTVFVDKPIHEEPERSFAMNPLKDSLLAEAIRGGILGNSENRGSLPLSLTYQK